MTDDRKGGLLLLAGTLGMLVTMSIHPTGHELFEPGGFETARRLAVGTHALALVSMPLSFLGTLALARRLAGPDRLALAALVLYGFALVAGMAAAAVSGFVAPELARGLLEAEAGERALWNALLEGNHEVNQAFARILVVGSSAALVLWSAAILRGRALARWLGLYGLVASVVVVLAIGSGHVHLDAHGFGMVVLAQAVWFLAVGVQLVRAGAAPRA
jgi:hypothetical protein